jgi:serine/threonine protein kinase/Tfp pilus assembly protein PilF
VPGPGDELAGFRIIAELGRGAFARVYLAEEINLGRRLVAIKVSRPDGEEPQILARLQHTHIVPVHSVCDDPTYGLRVLCMPYFGGANLAQVLEAAGGLDPASHDGRSLVNALDQISRQRPSNSNQSIDPSRARRHGSWRSNQLAAAGGPAHSTSGGAQALATSRFRTLLARWVRPRSAASSNPGPQEPDQEQDQPSRQFLHGASAIQAAVWIVARLAEGLEHAHSRGLLHRDLKPANVLLAGDGTPMLLDFNLAALVEPERGDAVMRRALIGGTLPYMSPEHLDAFNPRGSTPPEAVDERSDIYALGLLLFEMLSGEHPFPEPPRASALGDTILRMIDQRRAVPSLRARCRQIPWSLDALVAKCLSFDPGRRYQRARDLAEDLRRFLENLPMKHGPEPSVRERMSKWARRHPGLCGSTSIALFSLVLLVLLGGAVALVYDKMQGLAARVMIRLFDREFTEAQFLLNTATGSDEHLDHGLARASETLARLRIDEEPPLRFRAWQAPLAPAERRRFTEQVVELVMLEARACVVRAEKRGAEGDRRSAIERAIARLDRALRIDPEPPSALYAERARYRAALGDARAAARDRALAAARPPATCHDLTLLGSTLLAGGDAPRAEEALRQALRLDVTSFWTWFVLGHCHYIQRRFLEAAGDFAACSARAPSFAWVHFNRGLALAKSGRLFDAEVAYDRALELEPNFAEARVDRALVELELDHIERARADLIRAIELGRTDLVVFAALGETWARLGRRDEAERYFAGLLARNSGDPLVHVARGITRIHTDPAGAKADFAGVIERDPRSAHAHYGMALLIRQTDPREAIAHLDRALDANANLIDAVQLRALVRARLGERGALDDVDRLLESPTPNRLYNAACAVAIYSETASEPRLRSHALELLGRAIRCGFPAGEAIKDPDLKPLHASPQFARVVAAAAGK